MAGFFRKGQTYADAILVIVILFAMGIVAIFGANIVNELNTEIQADDSFSSDAKAVSSNVQENYSPLFDNIFVIVLGLFWLLLLVSAFMIDTHPIFFFVMIFLLVVVFIVGMALSNAYSEVAEDTDISADASAFTKTIWVMDNLLIIMIVMGFTSAIALYAKSQT